MNGKQILEAAEWCKACDTHVDGGCKGKQCLLTSEIEIPLAVRHHVAAETRKQVILDVKHLIETMTTGEGFVPTAELITELNQMLWGDNHDGQTND